MENTVTISVKEYDKLRNEFKNSAEKKRLEEKNKELENNLKEIVDNDFIRIRSSIGLFFNREYYLRKDKTPLPGFDENDYAANSNGNTRNLQGLLTELAVVRQATLSLFNSFSQEQLTRIGIASNNEVSVRAIGFIIIGHQKHHQKIFAERYL